MPLTRRQLLAAATPAAASAFQAAPARPRPNIVVLMTDDQGAHDLGCYGAGDLRTPNIDALAANGARFTNWYSNAPVCAPSRGSLMTGRYPARAGIPSNGAALKPEQLTTARILKNAGYRTGLIGKWHLGDTPESSPNAHGFDYFYGFLPGCVDFYSHRYYWGESGRGRTVNFHSLFRNNDEIFEDGEYLTDRVAAEAAGFIRRNWTDPFFLTVTFNAPHYPMHAPRRYLERFPNLAPERRTYAAMLAAVDDAVGGIRAELSRNRLLENTLIFYIADNGATTEPRAGLNQEPATAGDNSPYRGFKFSLFDGGMHVPGIMSWPGQIPSGRTIGEIAMTMDILPTACAAAGVAPPEGHKIDGSNILPLAAEGAPSPHEAIFWENNGQLAARMGKWKLVLKGNPYGRTPGEKKPLSGEDEVFLSDLEADPGEAKNLHRLHPNIVDELTSRIHAWKREVSGE
ncbi:MAG: sulfatase-like hydrolase/transferase [Bryobacteraceae bacterium]